MKNPLVPEGEVRNGTRLPEASPVLQKDVADVRRRTIAIVGESFGNDSDASRTIPFVVDFFDLSGVLIESGAPADGTLDVLLGKALLFRVLDHFGQERILVGIRSALGGEGNEFGMDGESFAAYGVLFAFMDADVMPLGMSGHNRFLRNILSVRSVFEFLQIPLHPPVRRMALGHLLPERFRAFGTEGFSDVVDPVLGDMVARFHENFSLERLLEVIGIFRYRSFESGTVFVLFEKVGDIGSEIETGKLVGHDFVFDFALVPYVTRGDLMMVADADFRQVVPYEHGRDLIRVRTLHFREDVADLSGVERMFGNAIRRGNPTKSPSLVLDIFQVEGFEDEIGNAFGHGTGLRILRPISCRFRKSAVQSIRNPVMTQVVTELLYLFPEQKEILAISRLPRQFGFSKREFFEPLVAGGRTKIRKRCFD